MELLGLYLQLLETPFCVNVDCVLGDIALCKELQKLALCIPQRSVVSAYHVETLLKLLRGLGRSQYIACPTCRAVPKAIPWSRPSESLSNSFWRCCADKLAIGGVVDWWYILCLYGGSRSCWVSRDVCFVSRAR